MVVQKRIGPTQFYLWDNVTPKTLLTPLENTLSESDSILNARFRQQSVWLIDWTATETTTHFKHKMSYDNSVVVDWIFNSFFWKQRPPFWRPRSRAVPVPKRTYSQPVSSAKFSATGVRPMLFLPTPKPAITHPVRYYHCLSSYWIVWDRMTCKSV